MVCPLLFNLGSSGADKVYGRRTRQAFSDLLGNYLNSTFQTAGEFYGVPPALLKAVSYRESAGFDRYARSEAGAVGAMQFIPGTAGDYDLQVNMPGIEGYDPSKPIVDDRTDPVKSIFAGARYLSDINERIARHYPQLTTDERWRLTLASYNTGPNRILNYTANYANQFNIADTTQPHAENILTFYSETNVSAQTETYRYVELIYGYNNSEISYRNRFTSDFSQ